MRQRLTYRQPLYARAKGRNGWFVPKFMEFEFTEHADGTALVTLRLFSRRETEKAPLEMTLAVSEWEAQALAVQLQANQERRRRRERRLPGGRS